LDREKALTRSGSSPGLFAHRDIATASGHEAIADWDDEGDYPVTFLCDQLGVARRGYYRWRSGGPCGRERTDAELTEAIGDIHAQLDGHPGVRRVWAELAARGVQVSPTPSSSPCS
jgi:hypothetical protein